MRALRLLWSPHDAAPQAAASSVWPPLLALGLAGAYADYPLLLRYGASGFADLRLAATPDGMTPFSILVFLGLTHAAMVLLPVMALATSFWMFHYIRFALDIRVQAAGVRGIIAWGLLPLAVERLLAGALRLVCKSGCDLMNPAATNLAFFLNNKATSVFWYELARGVDVFNVWALCVLSIALARDAESTPEAIAPGLLLFWLFPNLTRAWLLG
jgi:hypothetical protein